MVTVLIGGDIVPIGRNLPYFRKGDAAGIFNDLLIEFEKSCLSIINLECPLIKENSPIVKNGPLLGVESDCINGLKNSKIDVVNLANNHIMDHGAEGLKNTLDVCSDAGISTVGARENLKEARQMHIRKIDKIRIGILAVAEHEFSIATDDYWGANPLDLIDYVRNVESQRDKFDYLVVLIHGGNECYPYPSPRLQETCRFMVEMGANSVIVQHTHCPGCYEEYKGAHIVYGQGNLIFEYPNQASSWNEGFLVKLSIAEDVSSKMDIIPYVQSVSQAGVRKMGKEQELLFRQSLKNRSIEIKDHALVRDQWLRFCENRKYGYLSNVLGYSRIFSKLNKNGFIFKYFYSIKSLMKLKNVICCESHREILETIMNHRMV